MNAPPYISEEVEFEVPLYAPARRFAARLSLAWTTFVEDLDDSTLIIVELTSKPTSFSRLLRLAEEWVRSEALGAIRFTVDGREYVLEAGEVDWELDIPAAAA
ncbi:MAG: hypothetical protein ACJ77E_15555 [Gaiellaceae bacterium]